MNVVSERMDSSQSTLILDWARHEAQQMQDNFIRPHHILMAILANECGYAASYMAARGLTKQRVRELLQPLEEYRVKKSTMLSELLATTIGEIYCRTFTTPQLSKSSQQILETAREKQDSLNLSQLNADLLAHALLNTRHSCLTSHVLERAGINKDMLSRLLASNIADFACVMAGPQTPSAGPSRTH